MSAKLLIHPTPTARRPEKVDNLSYLKDFGQTIEDLRLRTDVLEKVSGLCSVELTKSWNIKGGTAIPIPFDVNDSPNKNASLYSGAFTSSSKARSGILLESAGTWRADAQVTFGGGNGEGNAEIYLEAWNLTTRTLYRRRKFYARLHEQARSWSVHRTFVVPPELQGQIVVCCTVAHSAFWWYVLGGPDGSGLSVNRWDIDTTGTTGRDPSSPIPDGGEYE
ncbi:hypothetical protein A6411_10605 [Prescottella equi]|uniref:hypothetical protein n=1 Tax=Rhodococcus hoagii TaxID=43767 RepID=UPI0009BF7C7A|nr:hypothetical protein [Prescottella equi]NKS17297.1 hypothetical protein [Prescottella equi]NKS19604.1 hypothetical protein [Prescottella equi]OQQ32249.1 hypothetical protein A6411_10605 [Prescottella equi]